MALGIRIPAVVAAMALGTSGAFAQAVSGLKAGARGASAAPTTETSNEKRAVSPGTGRPPAADRSVQPPEASEPAQEATPTEIPDPSASRGSEPSFWFMIR